MFPATRPYKTHFLKTDPVHRIYLEESGNRSGEPIIFLHGGPGGSSQPYIRCFCDPKFFRIVQFDQRGCGKIKVALNFESYLQSLTIFLSIVHYRHLSSID